MYVSVITMFEIRLGIMRMARKDSLQGEIIDYFYSHLICKKEGQVVYLTWSNFTVFLQPDKLLAH